VEIPSALAVQVHRVIGGGDRGDTFTAELNRLATDLARAVPSLLAVSVTLRRLGREVPVTALAPEAQAAHVLSSLAVPLTAGEPADVLVVRAGDAGAFLLLADDLAGLLGAGYAPLEIDGHLSLPAGPANSFEAAIAELSVVNQAIGVLLDRGATPEAGLADLHRRAVKTETSVTRVSQQVLASLPPWTEDGRDLDRCTLPDAGTAAGPEREGRVSAASRSDDVHHRPISATAVARPEMISSLNTPLQVERPARVIVGVDGSAGAHAALVWAAAEARLRGAQLQIVRTWPLDPPALPVPASGSAPVDPRARAAEHEVEAESQSVRGNDLTISPLIRQGMAEEVLVDVSEDADLLVVGSRGRGSVRSLLLGSVSAHVASHSRCPVVVVPHLAARAASTDDGWRAKPAPR
jgi:nucleotide-binding universal stress UspA family protein